MLNILVTHGPNLNLPGQHIPDQEGKFIDCVRKTQNDETDFIVIIFAAFTHTSEAIRDAFLLAANHLLKRIFPMYMRVKSSYSILIIRYCRVHQQQPGQGQLFTVLVRRYLKMPITPQHMKERIHGYTKN